MHHESAKQLSLWSRGLTPPPQKRKKEKKRELNKEEFETLVSADFLLLRDKLELGEVPWETALPTSSAKGTHRQPTWDGEHPPPMLNTSLSVGWQGTTFKRNTNIWSTLLQSLRVTAAGRVAAEPARCALYQRQPRAACLSRGMSSLCIAAKKSSCCTGQRSQISALLSGYRCVGLIWSFIFLF